MALIESNPQDRFEKAVLAAVSKTIGEIVEVEATAAAKRAESRVRAMTAQIAANVCSRMSMQQVGNELVIRLQFEEKKP